MAALESPGEWGVGRVLRCGFDIEDLSIRAHAPLGRHVEVWIPLEALDDPPPNAVPVE